MKHSSQWLRPAFWILGVFLPASACFAEFFCSNGSGTNPTNPTYSDPTGECDATCVPDKGGKSGTCGPHPNEGQLGHWCKTVPTSNGTLDQWGFYFSYDEDGNVIDCTCEILDVLVPPDSGSYNQIDSPALNPDPSQHCP
jgi:hypothetical protein